MNIHWAPEQMKVQKYVYNWVVRLLSGEGGWEEHILLQYESIPV